MKNSTDKTFCIGYWDLAGNAKHDASHYSELLPLTIKMLSGYKVVFFYDKSSILEWAMKIALENSVEFHPYKIPVDALPERDSAIKVLFATERFGELNPEVPVIRNKEKAIEHYWRDYKQGGRDVYLNMLAIWLSKISLVGLIVEENPFYSKRFAWVDASISRFNKTRDFFDFPKVIDCNNKISFYRGKLLKYGDKLALNASYLSGDRSSWVRLRKEFEWHMGIATNEVYPNDEETILDSIYRDKPDMFRMINPKRHPQVVRIMSALGLGAYRWGCY